MAELEGISRPQRLGDGRKPVEQFLRDLYDFTPAETRLRRRLLNGQSPSDVASALRVSIATVRTQLSAVLKKTGAQRQSDPVRRHSPLLLPAASIFGVVALTPAIPRRTLAALPV